MHRRYWPAIFTKSCSDCASLRIAKGYNGSNDDLGGYSVCRGTKRMHTAEKLSLVCERFSVVWVCENVEVGLLCPSQNCWVNSVCDHDASSNLSFVQWHEIVKQKTSMANKVGEALRRLLLRWCKSLRARSDLEPGNQLFFFFAKFFSVDVLVTRDTWREVCLDGFRINEEAVFQQHHCSAFWLPRSFYMIRNLVPEVEKYNHFVLILDNEKLILERLLNDQFRISSSILKVRLR